MHMLYPSSYTHMYAALVSLSSTDSPVLKPGSTTRILFDVSFFSYYILDSSFYIEYRVIYTVYLTS